MQEKLRSKMIKYLTDYHLLPVSYPLFLNGLSNETVFRAINLLNARAAKSAHVF